MQWTEIEFRCAICYLEIDLDWNFLIDCSLCNNHFHEECVMIAAISSSMCPVCKSNDLITTRPRKSEPRETKKLDLQNLETYLDHSDTNFLCSNCELKGTFCCLPHKFRSITKCPVCHKYTFEPVKVSDCN